MALKIQNPNSGGGVNLIDLIVPVGIILEFGNDVDPNTIYKGTLWQKYGEGRVTVGKSSDNTSRFRSIGSTGGVEKLRLSALIGAINNNSMSIAYMQTRPEELITNAATPAYTVIGTSESYNYKFKNWNHQTVVRDQTQKTNDTDIMNPYIVANKWIRVK